MSPSHRPEVKVIASGPGIGKWMLEHQYDDPVAPFVVIGGAPVWSARPGMLPFGGFLDGEVTLLLVVDGEFENNAEAAQVAIEQLSRLPDAALFVDATLAIEVRRREMSADPHVFKTAGDSRSHGETLDRPHTPHT